MNFNELEKRTLLVMLLLSVSVLLSCSTKEIKRDYPYSEIISKDTVWRGEVIVDGVVLVRKGATLRISPGTTIKLSGKKMFTVDEHEGFAGSGIKVEGVVLAEGTGEDPITFTSVRPEGPGSWDRLYFAFSKGNILKNCVIEYGGYAIHSHFSEITISSSLFRRNIEGVRLGGSKVTIKNSVFTGNRVRGINFRDSRNKIVGCAVYKNGVGIFLHSRNSRSIIKNNAIYNNKMYDLRMGDLHVDNMDISLNWWGSSDSSYIEERIYDGRDQEGLGLANAYPYLENPTVNISVVKGFLISEKERFHGKVYAIKNLDNGFSDRNSLASAETDDAGAFELYLPPGRYFIYGRSEFSERDLFGFTGNNPMMLEPFEEKLVAIPLIDMEQSGLETDCSHGGTTGLSISVQRDGNPVTGSFVYLYPADALDIRGPGILSGITSPDGIVDFKVSPGSYIVVVRKRSKGHSRGIVDFGGLFGISPHLPVPVQSGCVTKAIVPVFVKEGIVSEGGVALSTPIKGRAFAFLEGSAAKGYLVYFYRSKRPVGRPDFVSAVVGQDGSFFVENQGTIEDGDYFAFLRKAATETAGSSEMITAGPLRVKIEKGIITPSALEF